MAASNALACANMALAGFDPLIPFDEVVDAAKAVAERMPREHRCTSLGGLAVTPTSLRIQARLEAARGAGCLGCGLVASASLGSTGRAYASSPNSTIRCL